MMIMKQIVVSFPLEPNAKRSEISNLVNSSLESIKSDIISWNGFVDMRNAENGNYVLMAKCDNDEVRSKMQCLLNLELKRRNAA